MILHRIDHIGINVKICCREGIFLDTGMEVMGEMDMEGELVEKSHRLADVKRTRMVMTFTSWRRWRFRW